MTLALKARIARRDPLIGTFVFLPSPEVIEILALSGMDYVIIDMEHSPKDWQTLQHMIRAADIHRLPVLIRVRAIDPKLILQCLEIGAEGIVLPFVQQAADVMTATAAAFYPPTGTRGTCTLTRMTGYGARRSEFLQYCRDQDQRVVIVAQVEDPIGVNNIDSIVAVTPAIDAILVGRSDLASAFGQPGQVDARPVLDATDRIIETAHRRPDGPAVAMGLYTPEEREYWHAKGCTMFFGASDGAILHRAASEWVRGIRPAAG
ncbi:MAG: hypothetical protein RL322_3240 [Pseudomonadota bacterium]|jgi:4-hydroxy-2-oxoheptanedioate aldolase